jgi:transposase
MESFVPADSEPLPFVNLSQRLACLLILDDTLGMKPYSKDLRLRVLAAVDRGLPREEVAKTFSVSVPSIKRWLRLRRETGDVEPTKGVPGPAPLKAAALKEWLPTQLLNNPDLTLHEHCQAFLDERGTRISTATMSRAIGSLPGEWPLKKSLL